MSHAEEDDVESESEYLEILRESEEAQRALRELEEAQRVLEEWDGEVSDEEEAPMPGLVANDEEEEEDRIPMPG